MINAIAVRESDGYYEVHSNDEPEAFDSYLGTGAVVVQAEPLTGWAPWTFAVQLDGELFSGQWLFIDVAPGQDPASCPVCEGMGVLAPPCPACDGAGWLAKDDDGLVRCHNCDGTGGRPGPVPACPVCRPVTVAP